MTRHIIPLLLFAAACSVEKASRNTTDTTAAPPARDSVPRADTARGAVFDTAPAMAATDSGSVLFAPEEVRRGGVLVAVAQGLAVENPRCSWKGTSLPCYRTPAGVR